VPSALSLTAVEVRSDHNRSCERGHTNACEGKGETQLASKAAGTDTLPTSTSTRSDLTLVLAVDDEADEELLAKEADMLNATLESSKSAVTLAASTSLGSADAEGDGELETDGVAEDDCDGDDDGEREIDGVAEGDSDGVDESDGVGDGDGDGDGEREVDGDGDGEREVEGDGDGDGVLAEPQMASDGTTM
jgi:hypothetical protein